MATLYLVGNGPQQTTAAFVAVTTGTVIKSLLQVKPLLPLKVCSWGFSCDGFAAAAPGKVELIEVDVAATVTASAEADITKYDRVSDTATAATVMTLSTTGTGYTATAEGSITACRNLDGPQFLAPSTQSFIHDFPLGREPLIQVAKFARIRVTFAAAVNAYCWMLLEG